MTLRDVETNWSSCTACPLSTTRRQVVCGSRIAQKPLLGAPLILFIGETPGRTEDEEGKAFVGPAGKLFRDEYLTPADVRFAYLDYGVACFAGRLRAPEPDELAACAPRMEELVAALKPKGICAVGRIAEQLLLEAPWAKDYPVMSVVAPSLILKKGWPNPTVKKMVQAQVEKLKRFVAQLSASPEAAEVPQEHVCDFQERGAWSDPKAGLVAPLMACMCGQIEPAPRRRKATESKADLDRRLREAHLSSPRFWNILNGGTGE